VRSFAAPESGSAQDDTLAALLLFPASEGAALFHTQSRQGFLQGSWVDRNAAAVGFYVFDLIEGAEEAKFDRAVLLGVG
jgi:hypothetical protein